MELSTNRSNFDAMLRRVSEIPNIYFQPPSNIRMQYPCIVYKRETINNRVSDNSVYNQHVYYQVTVIDQKPNSIYTDRISKIVNSRHIRNFETEGLNHDIFRIYY